MEQKDRFRHLTNGPAHDDRRVSGQPAGSILTLVAAFTLVLMLSLGVTPATALAQSEQSEPLEIGAIAPDFELPGATRFGTLEDPVRLSDFEGKTVVLAFFFRARTPG